MTQQFKTTRWSMVLRARDGRSEEAMAYLCSHYWQPLYVFAIRNGQPHETAQELTQEFFARLLEGRFVKNVKKDQGRFRSFLLGCFKHFMAHEWRKVPAEKRGGKAIAIPADADFGFEPATDELSPDEAYDRQWALTLLANVMQELEDSYGNTGKDPLFHALKHVLSGEPAPQSLKETATSLDMTEGALKVASHRLRRRYRDLLRTISARSSRSAANYSYSKSVLKFPVEPRLNAISHECGQCRRTRVHRR